MTRWLMDEHIKFMAEPHEVKMICANCHGTDFSSAGLGCYVCNTCRTPGIPMALSMPKPVEDKEVTWVALQLEKSAQEFLKYSASLRKKARDVAGVPVHLYQREATGICQEIGKVAAYYERLRDRILEEK